jgi:DNA-directed RNA polymerase I subunit RPA1
VRSNGSDMFFLEVIPVTPNRFRPENKLGDQTFLHGHTVVLTKILQLNLELRTMIVLQKVDPKDQKAQQVLQALDNESTNNFNLMENTEVRKSMEKIVQLTDVITKWLEIQDAVNCFMDASKASKASDREQTGIRQLLEKKEGLFRMKMMGKRVNYAARSVISPDPNLNTNEVGVPLFMAKKLTFPENINEYNVSKLREYIINGSQVDIDFCYINFY